MLSLFLLNLWVLSKLKIQPDEMFCNFLLSNSVYYTNDTFIHNILC